MAGTQPIAQKGTSTTTRNVITIILLVLTFVVPLIGVVGVFVMWFWTTWKKWVKILITIPFTLIPLSIIFLFIYIDIARPFQISGDSMMPSYKNGEYVFSTIYHQNQTSLHRGDVIILISPLNPDKYLDKRAIGMPGDTIELMDGFVYINGQKLDENA